MNATATRTYRLATAEQWRDGVLAGVVRGADGQMQPFAPYVRLGLLTTTPGGASLPAVGGDGAAWWRGNDGQLRRIAAGSSAAEVLEAPHAIAHTKIRIVGCRHVLWAAEREGKQLICYALDNLQPILRASVADGEIADLADAGKNGVWVLVSHTKGARLAHFSCAGSLTREQLELPPELAHVRQLAFLRDTKEMALLAADGRTLWLRSPDGVLRKLAVGRLEEGARAIQLASDGLRLLFIAVQIGDEKQRGDDERYRLLVLDVQGDLLDTIDLNARPTGIAARGAQLLVAGAQGATIYSNEGTSTTATGCELITPVLYSPKRVDTRGWLRAELAATLPLGATVTLEYFEFDDTLTRDFAVRIAHDVTLTPRQRVAKLGTVLRKWSTPVAYAGSVADVEVPMQQLSMPLFDVRSEHIWLRIRLDAPAGASPPRLVQVRVLYPERSLIEHLPAIYRSETPGDFLREFIGVLEATTQGLDRRIATLGQLLDPATADSEWLDYTARWLGLPWDDALTIEQKRALMQSAHIILATRGTRQALETLLRCLFPEQPPRFRVRDTADSEPLRLGAGATLPSRLDGLPVSAATLGRKTILGHARLPDPQEPGAGLAPAAQVRIDISATAAERKQAEPWLSAVIDALIPVTARAVLRWRRRRLDGTGTTLGDDTILGEPPETRLGDNAIIGGTRLPESRITRLPADGADVGFHLR